ncbi:MAG: hypothetical protein JZU72_00075 [Chlorobium phaeobacteroides]|nr:hypothetical protein [Chlorobium phaeobacteroides]
MVRDFFLIATVLCLQAVSCTAYAETVANGETQNGWRFAVTPYVWLTGMSGRVAPVAGIPPAEVNTSFSDILGSVDAGGFLTLTAFNDDIYISGDFSYGIVSGEGELDIIPVNVKVKSTQIFGSISAGWRCMQTNSTDMFLTAGTRAWRLETSVNTSLGNTTLVSIDESFGWIDPIAGLRFRAKPSNSLSLDVSGEAGGFGVGSDFTWQLFGTVNYRISGNMYSSLGYRHISVDYDDNGHIFDANLSGLLIGISALF